LIWLVDVMEQLGESDMAFIALGYGQVKLGDASPESMARSLMAVYNEAEYTSTNDAATGLVKLSDHTALSATIQKYSEPEALIAVKLISKQMDNLSDYQHWFALIEEQLSESGLKVDWRLNVQSMLQETLESEIVWEVLEDHEATNIPDGEYHDVNTISRTFYVPYLVSEAKVRDHLVNVQAAVHQSTVDGDYRVTLGAPLITVEY